MVRPKYILYLDGSIGCSVCHTPIVKVDFYDA